MEHFSALYPAVTLAEAARIGRALGVTIAREPAGLSACRGYTVREKGARNADAWAETPAEAVFLAEALALDMAENRISFGVSPSFKARCRALTVRALAQHGLAADLLAVTTESEENGTRFTLAAASARVSAFLPRRIACMDIATGRLARAACELAAAVVLANDAAAAADMPEAEAAPVAADMPEAAPAARYVDVTPAWAGLLPALLAVLENGTAEGAAMARAELARMAAAADYGVTAQGKAEKLAADLRALTAEARAALDLLTAEKTPESHGAAAVVREKARLAIRAALTPEAEALEMVAEAAAACAELVAEARRLTGAAEAARFAFNKADFSRRAAALFDKAADLAAVADSPRAAETLRRAALVNQNDSALLAAN